MEICFHGYVVPSCSTPNCSICNSTPFLLAVTKYMLGANRFDSFQERPRSLLGLNLRLTAMFVRCEWHKEDCKIDRILCCTSCGRLHSTHRRRTFYLNRSFFSQKQNSIPFMECGLLDRNVLLVEIVRRRCDTKLICMIVTRISSKQWLDFEASKVFVDVCFILPSLYAGYV